MPYDATNYASSRGLKPRAGTWCSPIDADSMKRINPQSFQSLTDLAADSWGADWDKYYTNPPDYPEDATQACVVGPAVLTFDDSPQCTSLSVESPHVALPDSGQVNLSYESGSSALAHITVTDVAAFPQNGTVTADIDLGQLGGVGSVYLSSSVDNSLSSNAQLNNNNITTSHISAVGVARQSCFQPLTNVSCTATGRGRIQIAYTGALWFNYPTPRGSKDNPSDTHYKWALFSDTVTKSQDARSTYISFTATVSSYTLARVGGPRCLFDNSPNPPPQPTPSTKSRVPAYAYAVPIVLVAALAAALAYYFRRRRRTNRTRGTRLLPVAPPTSSAPTASAMSQVATSWDPSTVYMAPPTTTSGTEPQTQRWSSSTSAWDASLPAYSEHA